MGEREKSAQNRAARRTRRPSAVGTPSPAHTVSGRVELQRLAKRVVADLDDAAPDAQSLRLLRQGIDRGLAEVIAARGRRRGVSGGTARGA